MVNKTTLALAALALALPLSAAADNQTYVDQTESTQILGTTFGAEVQAGNPPAVQSMQNNANITVLSQPLSPLATSTNPPVTIDGVTYTEVYSFGKKIFQNAFYFSSTQPNQFTVGLTPTEVRVPFLIYPVVGPLVLEVAGGARFQANLNATLTPYLDLTTPSQTTLGVDLEAIAQAAGFVEADLSLLFLRGGVGGQVYLIDGNAQVNGRIAFDGSKPVALVAAMVSFLNGSIYAFIDFTGLFGVGWERLYTDTLYSWAGYCFSTGGDPCPTD